MKKLFLTFLFLLSVITSFAYDALIDGVYYNLNKDEQTAEVTNATGMGWSYSYSGSVVIPETIAVDGVSYSVTSIGAMAFMACSDVTSVTMPNTVTTIGGDTFAQCVALSSVTLSNSLKYIGGGAFRFCQELTSVEIPNSVTSIGDYAFSGCSGLTSLTIGNSVETIGLGAFSSCTGLTSMVIPNSVKSLGESVFCDCSKLTSVTIGHSVTSIESNFFLSCSALTTLIVDKDNPYFSVEDNVLFNKDMSRLIFSLPTKSGNYAVPNSVTTIDEAAFKGCRGLTSMEIPNSVISIGASAFSGCTGLTSLIVDNGNQSYSTEDNVLYNKDKSELLLCLPGRKGNFVIPTSVKAIGAYAFCGCSLTSIDIPNSVANIGSYAFDCSGLTSIALPNSLTKIEDGVFAGCSLTSIEIPNSIKTIGECAFAGSGLTSIEIPNSVTSIGASAFSGCSKLASISLPRSLTDIGDYAFFAIDNSLISVKVGWKEPIGKNFFTIGFNFQIIEEKTDLYVPRGTKEAYAAVFGWNRFKEIIEYDYTEVVDGIPYVPDYSTNTVDITGGEGQNTGDVVIPETIDIDGESYTVTSIGENAFSGCSDMTSVSIPKSVTSIGDFAFANCTSLSEVYVEWEEPLAIPAHVFANVESSSVRRYKSKSLLSTTLYVPKGTKEKYAAADVWKDFSAIMEYDPTGISSILSDSKAKVAKHLVNGRLIIEKDGKRYDACGAEMK